MATIFIIQQPDRTFCGTVAGISFHNGRGSTSDRVDVEQIRKKFPEWGISQLSPEEYRKQVEAGRRAKSEDYPDVPPAEKPEPKAKPRAKAQAKKAD